MRSTTRDTVGKQRVIAGTVTSSGVPQPGSQNDEWNVLIASAGSFIITFRGKQPRRIISVVADASGVSDTAYTSWTNSPMIPSVINVITFAGAVATSLNFSFVAVVEDW